MTDSRRRARRATLHAERLRLKDDLAHVENTLRFYAWLAKVSVPVLVAAARKEMRK